MQRNNEDRLPAVLLGSLFLCLFQLGDICFYEKIQKGSGNRRETGRRKGSNAQRAVSRRGERQGADMSAKAANRQRRTDGNAQPLFYHGKDGGGAAELSYGLLQPQPGIFQLTNRREQLLSGMGKGNAVAGAQL